MDDYNKDDQCEKMMICIAETFHCEHSMKEIDAFIEKLVSTVVRIEETGLFFASFYEIIQNEKTPLLLIWSGLRIVNILLKGVLQIEIMKTLIGKNIDLIEASITKRANESPEYTKIKEEYEVFVSLHSKMKHLFDNGNDNGSEAFKLPALDLTQKIHLKELFSNEDTNNNIPLSTILPNTIDNLVEGVKTISKVTPPKIKVLENIQFNSNESEIDNETIIISTNSQDIKSITFISLNLLMSKFTQSSYYNLNLSSLRKYCMEQKMCLFSTEVTLSMLQSYYNHTKADEYIEMLNLYLINNFYRDIANNFELKRDIKLLYEAINQTKSSIVFCNRTIPTKEIITLLEDFDPMKIYYRLQMLGGIDSKAYPIVSPTPIYQSIQSNRFIILEQNMIEIARQMTIVTHFLFRKIQNSELCNCNWMKGDKEISAPNITKLIVRFNQIAYWICEEILAYDKEQDRARVIEQLIVLADELRKMKNYNDCYNIITAFNYLPVKRLLKTWEKVRIEYIETLRDINDLCSLGGNFANLRIEIEEYRAIENKTTGCVPYVGYFLKRLAFLDEGPKYFKETMINPDKINKTGEIMAELKYYQQFGYSFTPLFSLAFLADPKPPTEVVLMDISEKLEPVFLLEKNKQKEKRMTSIESSSVIHSFGPNYSQFLKENSEKVTKTMTLKEQLVSLHRKKTLAKAK